MPLIVTAVLVSQLLGFGLAEIWSLDSGLYKSHNNLWKNHVPVPVHFIEAPTCSFTLQLAGILGQRSSQTAFAQVALTDFYAFISLCVPVFGSQGRVVIHGDTCVPYQELVVRTVRAVPLRSLSDQIELLQVFGAYGLCTNLCDASLGLRLWHGWHGWHGWHDGRVYWSWKAPRSSSHFDVVG